MNYFLLFKQIYSIYDRSQGQTLTARQIASRIRRAVPFRECRLRAVSILGVSDNYFEVSGMYDPELDEVGDPPILMEVVFPAKSKTFTFDEDDLSRHHWLTLSLDFASILGHEYVHLNQSRARNFRVSRDYRSDHTHTRVRALQEYYGDPDEIDAYAFTAAAQLANHLITDSQVREFQDTGVYSVYSRVFDENSKVMLKLQLLTDKYYKRLERQYHATWR